MISLKVIGGVELHAGDGQSPQKVLAQPKRLALLVYLAATPDRAFHSRDELFDLLWPDLGTERARAALSQALYFLRKELGESLVVTRGNDEVGLDHAQLDCDLAEFHRAWSQKKPARVLELYRGEVLEGLFLVDSIGWEEWLFRERERVRNRASESAWVLAEQARDEGRARDAARLGAKALQLSADDERILRQLLSLLDKLGDRAGVARTFRAYSERLNHEYDIEVAPETRELYDDLMSRAPRVQAPGDPAGIRAVSLAPAQARRAGEPAETPVRSRPFRLAWAAAGAGVLVIAFISWLGPRFAGRDLSVAPSELVRVSLLPFQDRGADPGMNFLAPGMREELALRLGSLDRVQVQLWDGQEPLLLAGAAPKDSPSRPAGDHQLEGDIVATDTGLRIDLTLSSFAGTERQIQQSVSIAMANLLQASTNAAEWAATLLLPAMTTEERRRLRRGSTTNPEAFQLYLRGRYQLMSGSAESFAAARALFEEALALEPEFSRAWSGLSDAFVGLTWTYGLPRSVAVPRAREAAERSLDIDPGLAEGHASLALILNRYYWDSGDAERHFREAIRLDPANADARLRYSALLRNMGRLEDARVQVEAALALDPITFHTHKEMIILDLMDQRNEQAIARARQLVELNPAVPMARFFLARCLIESARYEEALEHLDHMGPMADRPPAQTLRGYIMGVTGRADEALRIIRSIKASAERMPDMPVDFDLAVVYLGLGERQQVLSSLNQAAEYRDFRIRLLRQEPMFHILMDEPAFLALLQRAGLPLPETPDTHSGS